MRLMSKPLAPKDIRSLLSIGKTKQAELLNEYEANGGTVYHLGKRDRRVPEDEFLEFLSKRGRK